MPQDRDEWLAAEAACAFEEKADIHTSSDEYAARFAGASGAWMLDVQERLARRLLHGVPPGAALLDVGGGHGQLAVPLSCAGYRVTVLGSSAFCRKRVAAAVDGGAARFVAGDVLRLPFEDGAFDAVLAFRMLTHCGQWPALVGELCRCAKRAVVVDYPTSQGLNAVAPALFEAKKRVENNTRYWRLFRHAEVRSAFAANGWRPAGRLGQFFLPMVLHRMLKSRGLSAGLEALCRAAGLTRLWGSPAVSRWEPAA